MERSSLYKQVYKTGAVLAVLMLFIIGMSDEPQAVSIATLVLGIDVGALGVMLLIQLKELVEDDND